MAATATCRWGADVFTAQALFTGPPGAGPFSMRALTGGPRFVAGTKIEVQASEIVEWFPDPDADEV